MPPVVFLATFVLRIHQSFLEEFRPDMDPNTTFDFLSIDGGINDQLPAHAGFEAVCWGSFPCVRSSIEYQAINIDYSVGIATGVPVTFISTGTNGTDDPFPAFLDQVHHLLSLPKPPQTIVHTYADVESDTSPQMAVSV